MPLSKTDLTPNIDVTHLRSSQGNLPAEHILACAHMTCPEVDELIAERDQLRERMAELKEALEHARQRENVGSLAWSEYDAVLAKVDSI